MGTVFVRNSRCVWPVVAAMACALISSRARTEDQPARQVEAERQMKLRQEAAEAARQAVKARLLQNHMRQQRLIEVGKSGMPYDDLVSDDVEMMMDEMAPRQKTGMLAGYFEQLVFGSAGANAIASQRIQLDESLRSKVGSLQLACGLSDRQARQLELAGQGDIKRLLDRINRRTQEYLQVRDEDSEQAIREVMSDSMTYQPLLRSPFGENSLFARTLKHVLTSEQWDDYDLARRMERLGGRIVLRSHGSQEIKTLQVNASTFADSRLAPWKGWANVRGLTLESTTVVDADLARLAKLGRLKLLDLGATRVTSEGLVHVKELQNLKVLDLRRTEVDDAGLAHVSGVTGLESLHLGCTSVTGAGLVHLRNLTNLQTLFVFQTGVSDDDLVHLEGLGKLKELGLDGTKITDAGLAHLTGLINLQTLALSNTSVTDAGLRHLKKLKNLKTITVFGTKVSDIGAARLKQELPGLKVIQ